MVSPLTLLQWTQDLITKGVASEIIARTIQRDTDPAGQAARQQDAVITTLRLGAAGEQSMDNPEWVKFLVFGNDGFTLDADKKLVAPPDGDLVVRKPLQAFIPDARHAVLAAVLVGNAPLDQLAKGSAAVQDALKGSTFENATVTVTGTPTFLTDINDYLQGGMLILGADRRAGDDGDPAGRIQGSVAAAAAASEWWSGSSGGSARSGSPARSCRS